MNFNTDDEVKDSKGSVHLLLVGQSKGHISRVIEIFEPIHLDLFTSAEMLDQVTEFISSTNSFKGTYHISVIPSFTEYSLFSGISIIYSRYTSLKSSFPGIRIYFGITGGTNTMAVEMALSAVMVKEPMHYMVKAQGSKDTTDDVILFDSEELNRMIKNSTIGGGR